MLLDGVDVRSLSVAWLRAQIGLVSQDTFLFHDTIENNIRYGQLDASDKEVHKAALLAHAATGFATPTHISAGGPARSPSASRVPACAGGWNDGDGWTR